MDAFYHRFSELFAQLGLSREPADIRDFIKRHSPLPAERRLEDATFWSAAQAALLREKLMEDADWAEVVDQLNAALRLANASTIEPAVRVVCLCASWCGVCRDFVSQYQETMRATPSVVFDWYDIEDDVERLGDVDVESFPCILIGVQGEPVFFGPILPNRGSLELLIQRAPNMTPLPQSQVDRDRLETILRLK
jgi:thiol-disulfide isomerase/thioredoxin